jgi:iron(III) transport system substrate-binding protein
LTTKLLENRLRSQVLIGWLLALAFVLVFAADTAEAASKPVAIAELALYRSADRTQVLMEGARREGQLTFYNSLTSLAAAAQAFEKKYPFIKISVWRSDSTTLIKRVTEEHASGRFLADVVETSGAAMALLYKAGVFQEYYSPELVAYGDEVKAKGKSGVYYLADRENYTSLGFNTKLISPAEAPKTYKDLLDPKWKGKMSLAGTSTGVHWVGNVLNVMGREYLDKFAAQDVKLQNMSAVALAGLVVSGEVPLSPTTQDSNIFTARKSGAPVEWRPLEPVVANLGSAGMTAKAPHPHAALLFLDYLLSKEGQKVLIDQGLSTPREDVGSLEHKFNKTYLESKYSLEEFDKKFNEWEQLLRQLFLRKR